MSPYKLSLFNPGDDDDRHEIELDDELVGKLRETVDADPDLTLSEAIRQGIQRVVDSPPSSGSTGT
jgi:hypothetical protein